MRLPDLAGLDDPSPHARLLANDRYRVLLTGAGTGVSSLDGVALTAWSADRTEDGDGLFVYLRDLDDGRVWSAGHAPVGAHADRYAASYVAGTLRLERRDADVATTLETCVAPDLDVEVRRLTLANLSERPRTIEVTTYAEVVLIDPAAYAAHPAFSKLFVQTEYEPASEVLLARRRPRSAGEHHPWLVHACVAPGPAQYETDRVRFVGRGRTRAAPRALAGDAPLSATVGSVLDPIVSLRRVVRLAPGDVAAVIILLGAAATRDDALALTRVVPDAAFAGAAARERTLQGTLAIDAARAAYLDELAGAMLYGDPRLRAPADVLRRAHGSPSVLDRHGVRRDRLLAVATVGGAEDRGVLVELEAARAYWATRGLEVGVLALDETMPADERDVIAACAHLVVRGALPDLAGGLASPERRVDTAATARGPVATVATGEVQVGAATVAAAIAPVAANGLGEMSPDGSEYVIRVTVGPDGPTRTPPMPWTNVIANERVGFLVSESGAACTWSRNSRENRLTPWTNDPVRDPHGEALYVRDEETGAFWSPLPGPTGAATGEFEVRHGLGYSVWHHRSRDLEHEVTTFVPQAPAEPLKITRVRLTNVGTRPRRLALFAYARLVLGVLPETSGRLVVTEHDAGADALFARSRLNDEFAHGVVFAALVPPDGAGPVRVSGDRTAFLGRHGAPGSPATIARGAALDGTTGGGLDACAALQVTLDVPAGATVSYAVLLGECTSPDDARALVARHRAAGAIDAALEHARDFWREVAGGIRVATPEPAIDRMVNGWLAYQTLACRLWGRTAFYQSGGAFGFRDQLQDAAAFLLTRPALTRAQILLHAAHQFVEGDVQHWWHPPTGKGMRTRFADDLLWLPLVTAEYVDATGDATLLDERVGFVTARALAPGEDEAYLVPAIAAEVADVYAHCCRALDRSLTRGAHGLPLMGTGDWNDGMNRVGREGRGESVWMAFFLHRIIDAFAPLCMRRGDGARAERYRAYQADLRAALDGAAWDGAWYRRAYYDDGTPLGSAANTECRIDALAQAWAVLSHAVPAARAAAAMDAVERLLVDEPHGLVRLLAPPFDRDPHDPGYIKGYVPGIRENGGQYTHAALWVVAALAELGRRDRAAALLAMLSPLHHARTAADVATYQVEPYVVAADVYGVPPHVGRGGWTWYTGSAGWMQRIAVESVLGVRVVGGDTLVVAPRVPDAWPEFRVDLRLPDGGGDYAIVVTNPTGSAATVVSGTLDGVAAPIVDGAARIPLARDGARHRVAVVLGSPVD